MIRKAIIYLLFQFVFFNAVSQKEGNNWFFGSNAGINFNTSPPTALTTGQLNTFEGCASISDPAGKLLFYTDGRTVYNAQHNQMLNGGNLAGHYSSTQSAIIVKKPEYNNQYYIFTVDEIAGPKGLSYSVVDMGLDNGLGAVTTEKNIQLSGSTCEKITAIKHANQTDFWIVTHEYGSNKFQAFILTKNGVSNTPIESATGTTTNNNVDMTVGYMRSSTNGKKLALCIRVHNIVEVLDFNNVNGSVSNPIQLDDFSSSGPYGLEFSPSGRFLYTSDHNRFGSIYQFDLAAGNESDIQSSRVVIGKNDTERGGAFSIAPNGKVYYSIYGSGYLAAINSPDSLGIKCDFNAKQLFLGGRKSQLGLPSFYNSIFEKVDFTYSDTCIGDSVTFIAFSNSSDSVIWIFDDPDPKSQNTAKGRATKYKFSSFGSFSVKMVAYFKNYSDTVTKVIKIKDSPYFTLGNDTNICGQIDIDLDATTPGGSNYIWDNSTTNPIRRIYSEGNYHVKLEIDGCTVADTISVSSFESGVYLGPDMALCNDDDSLIIKLNFNRKNIQWQDNSDDSIYVIRNAGVFWVNIDNGKCEVSDTIEITKLILPQTFLPNDTTICPGDTLIIEAQGVFEYQKKWSTGENGPRKTITEQGIYFLQIDSSNCSNTDSISVKHRDNQSINILSDTLLCLDSSLQINLSNITGNYVWEDSSNSVIRVINAPTKKIWISVRTGDCGYTDSATIAFKDCNCFIWYPNAFTPGDNNTNDWFGPVIKCDISNYTFVVYNRWGEKLFETHNPNKKWSGHLNGRSLPNGVYFYIVQYLDNNNFQRSHSGNIHLIK